MRRRLHRLRHQHLFLHLRQPPRLNPLRRQHLRQPLSRLRPLPLLPLDHPGASSRRGVGLSWVSSLGVASSSTLSSSAHRSFAPTHATLLSHVAAKYGAASHTARTLAAELDADANTSGAFVAQLRPPPPQLLSEWSGPALHACPPLWSVVIDVLLCSVPIRRVKHLCPVGRLFAAWREVCAHRAALSRLRKAFAAASARRALRSALRGWAGERAVQLGGVRLSLLRAVRAWRARAMARQGVRDWARLAALCRTEANRRCADCRLPPATWASLNCGVLLCQRCAGSHRGLGVHVSVVRSTTLDGWSAAQVAFLEAVGGNAAANAYWEGASRRAKRPQTTGSNLV